MWVSIVTGVFGAITGMGGLIVAQLAYRAAKEANRISERAILVAEESNRIAIQANQLAKDSNTISQRAIDMTRESFDYKWGFHVNKDGTMWISHDGTHHAHDVTVFVEAQRAGKPIDSLHAHHRHEDEVTPGAQLFFKVESIFPKFRTQACSQPRKITAVVGDTAVSDGLSPIRFDVVATVTYQSPGGRQLGDVIKHSVSCRQNKTGRIEFRPNK